MNNFQRLGTSFEWRDTQKCKLQDSAGSTTNCSSSRCAGALASALGSLLGTCELTFLLNYCTCIFLYHLEKTSSRDISHLPYLEIPSWQNCKNYSNTYQSSIMTHQIIGSFNHWGIIRASNPKHRLHTFPFALFPFLPITRFATFSNPDLLFALAPTVNELEPFRFPFPIFIFHLLSPPSLRLF